jgi:hypothetical protein
VWDSDRPLLAYPGIRKLILCIHPILHTTQPPTQGDVEAAQDQFVRLYSYSVADFADSFWEVGRAFHATGHFQEALDLFETLSSHPTSNGPEVWGWMARCFQELGQLDVARGLWSQVLQVEEGSGAVAVAEGAGEQRMQAQFALASLLEAMGEHVEAQGILAGMSQDAHLGSVFVAPGASRAAAKAGLLEAAVADNVADAGVSARDVLGGGALLTGRPEAAPADLVIPSTPTAGSRTSTMTMSTPTPSANTTPSNPRRKPPVDEVLVNAITAKHSAENHAWHQTLSTLSLFKCPISAMNTRTSSSDLAQFNLYCRKLISRFASYRPPYPESQAELFHGLPMHAWYGLFVRYAYACAHQGKAEAGLAELDRIKGLWECVPMNMLAMASKEGMGGLARAM